MHLEIFVSNPNMKFCQNMATGS